MTWDESNFHRNWVTSQPYFEARARETFENKLIIILHKAAASHSYFLNIAEELNYSLD